jgi:hypothetical protein
VSAGSKARAQRKKFEARQQSDAGDSGNDHALNPMSGRIKEANDAIAAARAAIERANVTEFVVGRELRSVILGPPLPDDATANEIAKALRLVGVANGMAADPERVRKLARSRVAASIAGDKRQLINVNKALEYTRQRLAQCSRQPEGNLAVALTTKLTEASTRDEVETALWAISQAAKWTKQEAFTTEPPQAKLPSEPSIGEIESARMHVVRRLTELGLLKTIMVHSGDLATHLQSVLAAPAHPDRMQRVLAAVVMGEEIVEDPGLIKGFLGRTLRASSIAGDTSEIAELNQRLNRARSSYSANTPSVIRPHEWWALRVLNSPVTREDDPYTVLGAMTAIAWVWRSIGKQPTKTSKPQAEAASTEHHSVAPAPARTQITPPQASKRASATEIANVNAQLDQAVEALTDARQEILELIDEITARVLESRLPPKTTFAMLARAEAALGNVRQLMINPGLTRQRQDQLARAKGLLSDPDAASEFSQVAAEARRQLRRQFLGPHQLRDDKPHTIGRYLGAGIKPGASVSRALTAVIAYDRAKQILDNAR